MLEMANPTGLMDQVRWEVVRPMREYIRQILVDLLGEGVGDRELRFCELNLVGPCMMAQLTCQAQGRMPGPVLLERADVEAFAEHCTEFTIAGLTSIRETRKASTEAD